MKSKFWSGWLTCLCANSLTQDYMGKQKFMQAVADRWVDASVTVPLALFGLCFAVWLHADSGKP